MHDIIKIVKVQGQRRVSALAPPPFQTTYIEEDGAVNTVPSAMAFQNVAEAVKFGIINFEYRPFGNGEIWACSAEDSVPIDEVVAMHSLTERGVEYEQEIKHAFSFEALSNAEKAVENSACIESHLGNLPAKINTIMAPKGALVAKDLVLKMMLAVISPNRRYYCEVCNMMDVYATEVECEFDAWKKSPSAVLRPVNIRVV